jgi:hypothetical protein
VKQVTPQNCIGAHQAASTCSFKRSDNFCRAKGSGWLQSHGRQRHQVRDDERRAKMPQVIVGLFSSYRDAHEALCALQLLGLGRDDGHLYRTEQRDADVRFAEGEAPLEVEPRTPDSAEYAAHGEHQGAVGTTNRFRGLGIDSPVCADKGVDPASNDASARALLVVNATTAPKLTTVWEVLYEHGAMAVKDPNGHWRFSPYRRVCRSQE